MKDLSLTGSAEQEERMEKVNEVLAGISRFQQGTPGKKELKQMQANGKTEAEEQAEFEKRIKEQEEFDKVMKLRRLEQFLENSIGIHYLRNFDEKRMRDKDKLDKKINDMFETGKGIILFGDVGVGKTMDLLYITRRIYTEQKDYDDRYNPEIPVAYYFMPALFNLLHQGKACDKEICDTR